MQKAGNFNVEKIKKYMKENNLSKTQFAINCKISVAVLNKVLADNLHMKISSVFKISRYMGVYIHELFL